MAARLRVTEQVSAGNASKKLPEQKSLIERGLLPAGSGMTACG